MVDHIDESILAYLTENSRYSATYIANELGIKPATVKYRIKKLFDSGIIKFAYPATFLTNLKLLRNYEILISFYHIDRERKEEIIKKLVSHPNITSVKELSGFYELKLFIEAHRSDLALATFDFICEAFRSHINDLELMMPAHLRGIKHLFADKKETTITKRYPKDGSFQELISKEKNLGTSIELDDLDLNILEKLNHNARIPYFQLQNELEVAKETIVHRVKRMINNNIISRFTLYLDYKKLGYKNYYIYFQLYGNAHEILIPLIKSIAYVESYSKNIGKWNFMFSILVKDEEEIERVVSRILKEVSDKIRDYKVLCLISDRCFKNFPPNFKEMYKDSFINFKKNAP